MNDNKKVMDMQKFIRELFVLEQSKDSNEMTNLSLLKEQIAVLSVSLVRDRGKLLNGSDKAA